MDCNVLNNFSNQVEIADELGVKEDYDSKQSTRGSTPENVFAKGTTFSFSLPVPVLVESIFLRHSRSVQHLRISSVKGRRTDSGPFQELTPLSSHNFDDSSMAVLAVRKKFAACGVAQHLQVSIVGNLDQYKNRKDTRATSVPSESKRSSALIIDELEGRRTTPSHPTIVIPRSESSFDFESEWEDSLVIAIHGFRLDTSPVASHALTLLNISHRLYGSSSSRLSDAVDSDFLGGQALMNSRNFNQAAEMFNRACQTALMCAQGLSGEVRRCLHLRAVELQLLVARSLVDPRHVFDKLQAFRFALELMESSASSDVQTTKYQTSYSPVNWESQGFKKFHKQDPALPIFVKQNSGKWQLARTADVTTSLLALQPDLTSLLLSHIQNPLHAVRIAALRALDFILEHLGCSVGHQFPCILNHLLHTFPIIYPFRPASSNSPRTEHSCVESDTTTSRENRPAGAFYGKSDIDCASSQSETHINDIGSDISGRAAPPKHNQFDFVHNIVNKARELHRENLIVFDYLRLLQMCLRLLPNFNVQIINLTAPVIIDFLGQMFGQTVMQPISVDQISTDNASGEQKNGKHLSKRRKNVFKEATAFTENSNDPDLLGKCQNLGSFFSQLTPEDFDR